MRRLCLQFQDDDDDDEENKQKGHVALCLVVPFRVLTYFHSYVPHHHITQRGNARQPGHFVRQPSEI